MPLLARSCVWNLVICASFSRFSPCALPGFCITFLLREPAMPHPSGSTLMLLLERSIGHSRTSALDKTVVIPESLQESVSDCVTRAELAVALNLLLFEDLVRRVPWAQAYVLDQREAGRKLMHDHGALRTVKGASGRLPQGKAAFARVLEPLGYFLAEEYPLERLGMTGHAYRHQDLPELMPQFFVSELHPERFSPVFQSAVARILDTTEDPLPQEAGVPLDELREKGELPFHAALRLLPDLVACFGRHHREPGLSDYEILLAESPEMAWISTEGNAFNHATDRVEDVVALAEGQKALGRPMKDQVECSASGRVIQTAYRAGEVERVFLDAHGRRVLRGVPGSFFEFITRKPESDGRLDLRFDAANAQGIFKMTASR